MKSGFLLLAILVGGFTHEAWALDMRAPQPKLEMKNEKSQNGSEQFSWVFSLPDKFHFNLEAPNLLLLTNKKLKKEKRELAPVVSKKMKTEKKGMPRELEFQTVLQAQELSNSTSGSTPTWTGNLYVCDDAKTFCDRLSVSSDGYDLRNGTRDTGVSEPSSKSSEKLQNVIGAGKSGVDAEGFILNDPELALATAKTKGLPLFIDFFGVWCPPCNELNEKVFSKTEFKKEAKNWILVKLDADRSLSWKWKSRYKVGGYPTVIFADAHGEEISRMVGFQPLKAVIGRMQLARASNRSTLVDLENKVAKGSSPSGLVPLIEGYIERREYDKAVSVLGGIPVKTEEEIFLEKWVKVMQLDPPKTFGSESGPKSEWYKKTSEFTKEYGHDIRSLSVQMDFLKKIKEGLSEEAVKSEADKILNHIENWKIAKAGKSGPKIYEIYGYSLSDLLSYQAEVHQVLGDEKAENAVWAEAAEWLRREKRGVADRGTGLELAYVYRKLANFAAASEVYENLIKKYPEEFTFYFAYAQMEFQRKNFGNAKVWVDRALAYSYEDNRLRVLTLLGKVAMGMRDSKVLEEVIQKIETGIRETNLPEDPTIRTHRYFKELKEILDEANALQKQLGGVKK